MATQKRFIAKNGLDNNAQTITNVATPVNTTDAVTKAYADLKPDLSSTTPAALGVAAVGTGTTAARADHVHTLPSLATLGAQAAGSYVTVGGALGTPSSGTVTNLTGTASININGTVGATTPNLGYFRLVHVGAGTGGVALSNNDGYGNSNVCFNHYAGTPDNSALGAGLSSAGRITCSVDSSTASLQFQLANATTSAVIPTMTAVATMYTTGITCGVNLTAPVLISNVATGTAPFTVTSTTPVANLNIGGTAANVTGVVALANGGTGVTSCGICKSWVSFVGSTATIIGSYNVSSITRTAAGTYTVNMTTALASTSYAVVSGWDDGGTTVANTVDAGRSRTTSTFGVYVANSSTGVLRDVSYVSVAVFI